MNIMIEDIRLDYILSLDNNHCKITHISSASPKYGIRKFCIEGINIITNVLYKVLVSGPSHGGFCSERIKLL